MLVSTTLQLQHYDNFMTNLNNEWHTNVLIEMKLKYIVVYLNACQNIWQQTFIAIFLK